MPKTEQGGHYRLRSDGTLAPAERMPALRIPPEYLDCIVYAYRDAPSAEAREGLGGTGFLAVAHTSLGEQVFLVTNRHIIEDGFLAFRFNARGGGTRIVESDERQWHFHRDENCDVAVLFIADSEPFKLRGISTKLFLRPDDIEPRDIRLGDEAALIGRFINHEGFETNMPTARFGYIAQKPGDPVRDQRGRLQPTWLVQVHSFPGFSGAPVLLLQSPADMGFEDGVNLTRFPPPALLGINVGHFDVRADIYQTRAGQLSRDLEASANTGLTSVLPAWKIDETITDALSRIRTRG